MWNFDIAGITMNQIQVFLSVAATENMSQSAEELHMSKSSLSKCIHQMESNLCLVLFIRSRQRLKLTPAGMELKKGLQDVTAMVEQAVMRAHSCQYSMKKTIVIGIPLYTTMIEAIRPFLEKRKEAFPDFSWRVEYYTFEELPEKLLSKAVDLILTAHFFEESLEQKGLSYTWLCETPLTASMLKTNPLAQRPKIYVEDLKSQRFITPSPRVLPDFMDYVINTLGTEHGFRPDIALYVSSTEALELNIQHDNEIFISDKYMKMSRSKEIQMVPITDTRSGVLLSWNDSVREEIDWMLYRT